jgi:hypothetical protein
VTAIVDRPQMSGPVSTTVTVNGTNNSANLNVSATYIDNSLVIPSGLQCFYTFDDGTANDMTENGVDGVMMNSANTADDGTRTYLKLNMITDD